MMQTPRFTVLTVTAPGGDQSYVVLDTQTGHIVQGAYQTQAVALGATAFLERAQRAKGPG